MDTFMLMLTMHKGFLIEMRIHAVVCMKTFHLCIQEKHKSISVVRVLACTCLRDKR